MAKKKNQSLGHRERQILDAVYRLGEASVADVLRVIPDPPGYSSVRKMMSLLEEKGLLRHRREGTKYIYRPVRSRESASRSAVKHLLATFFSSSPSEAVNAILDVSSSNLTDKEFERMRAIIDQARMEGQ
jgi:predicted transcriptional regulator